MSTNTKTKIIEELNDLYKTQNELEIKIEDLESKKMEIEKEELSKLGITNYTDNLINFMKEMKLYFLNTWVDEYNTIELFNETSSIEEFVWALGDTPTTQYEVLSNSFIPSPDFDKHFKILSKKTKIILDYYCGISFHDKE